MKKILEATQFDAYKNLARYLSNKKTVQIVDLMTGPLCTDGERILVPMVPDDMLEQHRNAIYGGIWHESAHIKRTDFDVFRKKRTPLMDTGLRLLEDIRIEYFEEQENPVARMEFEKSRDTYLGMHNAKPDEDLSMIFLNPHTFLANLIATAYFAYWKKRAKALPITIELVSAIMPIVNRFIKVARPGREGTHDAYIFAEEIENKLKELIENKMEELKKEMESSEEGEEGSKDKESKEKSSKKKKSKQKKEKDNDNGGQEDTDGEGVEDGTEKEQEEKEGNTGKSDSDTDDNESKEGSSEDDTAEHDGDDESGSDEEGEGEPGDDGDEENSSRKGRGNDEEEGDNVDQTEVYEKIRSLLEDASDQDVADLHEDLNRELREDIKGELKVSTKTQHLPAPGLEDQDAESHIQLPDDPKQRTDLIGQYNIELETVMAEVKRLERKTEPLISSKRRLHHLPGRKVGKLDPGMLYSVRSGNKRVFTQEEITRSMHTAISWLIDCSYSMVYGPVLKIREARKAVIAGAEQCHRLKIPFEVLGFSTKWNSRALTPPPGVDRGTYIQTYNRFYGLDHKIYHTFDDDFRKTKFNLAMIEAKVDNCDHESVLWAARRLYQRTERRKILFVLSDGLPQTHGSDRGLLDRELKRSVEEIKKVGIEVYGIGIFTDAVKQFYPEYSVINESTSISQAIYECLQKKIVSGLT